MTARNGGRFWRGLTFVAGAAVVAAVGAFLFFGTLRPLLWVLIGGVGAVASLTVAVGIFAALRRAAPGGRAAAASVSGGAAGAVTFVLALGLVSARLPVGLFVPALVVYGAGAALLLVSRSRAAAGEHRVP